MICFSISFLHSHGFAPLIVYNLFYVSSPSEQQILDGSGRSSGNKDQISMNVVVALIVVVFISSALLLLYFFYQYLGKKHHLTFSRSHQRRNTGGTKTDEFCETCSLFLHGDFLLCIGKSNL